MESHTPGQLPNTGQLTVVFKVDFLPEEAGEVEAAKVEFVGPGGPLSHVLGGLVANFDGATTMTQRVDYTFTVTEYGRHWFVASVDGAEIARLPLDVAPSI